MPPFGRAFLILRICRQIPYLLKSFDLFFHTYTIRERGHGTESYDFGLIVNHKSVGKSHYGELTIPYIFLLPPKLRNPKLIEAIAKRASMMAENSKKTNDPYNMNGVNKSNLSNGRLDFVGYIDGTNVKERNIGDMISGFYRK